MNNPAATKGRSLHQVLVHVLPGDATSDHAFVIRKWLRELGFISDIFSSDCHPSLESEVLRFAPGAVSSDDLLIFHHTIGSSLLDQLAAQGMPLLLVYHNITPPDFYKATDPALAELLELGREQLLVIRPQVRLALGASPYSELELKAAGYEETGVLPIVLNEADYTVPIDRSLQEQLQNDGPLLLFVGRVVKNKRQEDLLKLLYHLRHIVPGTRLALIGSVREREYVHFLRFFADKYELTNDVILTGHVSQQEMVTYYQSADLFVSMSEHEGFGKPLIESMYFGLPVMAYAAAAVPSTLGEAGVLFNRKEYEPLAELARLLIQNQPVRQQIVNRQAEHAETFFEPNVKQRFVHYLAQLGYL